MKKLTNIRNIGRYKNLRTGKYYNIKTAKVVGKPGRVIYYVSKGKRKYISDINFYGGNYERADVAYLDLKHELNKDNSCTTPRSQMGYYAIAKDGGFTDASPYEYRESAIGEAKKIHGKKYDYHEHVEEHITDLFYVMATNPKY